MQFRNKKVVGTLLIILHLVLFALPLYFDLYYLLVYYGVVILILFISIWNFSKDREEEEEQFYDRWMEKKEKGFLIFLLKHWFLVMGSLLFMVVFTSMIEDGTPPLEIIKLVYEEAWLLFLTLGTMLSLGLAAANWHENNERYMALHYKINKRRSERRL